MPGRTVIDTNTFLSAAIRYGSTPSLAVEKALSASVVLMSTETWLELESVLLRGKFDRYQAVSVRRRFLDALEPQLEMVSVRTTITVCRHPKDDKFLELTVDGRADMIVTGDNDLLTLNPFHGIAIMTASAYLAPYGR